MIGSPSAPAYASALRRIAAERTGAPSSLNPTAPASASSPIAARVSPARPVVTAPIASSSTGDPGRDGGRPDPCQHAGLVERRRRVRHRADRREPAVGGRGQPARDRLGILVAGLAQVGVQIDEARRDDDPARRRCRPRPRRRATSPPRGSRRAPRSRPGPRARPPGRPARPARCRGPSPGSLGRTDRAVRPGQQVEQRHPDRDAVGDLVGDDRVRAGGDVRRRSRHPRSSAPGA